MIPFQQQIEAELCLALCAAIPALSPDVRRLRRSWELGLSLVDQLLSQKLIQPLDYARALKDCRGGHYQWEGYAVERELGRGRAGVVYLARDASGRALALKLLQPGRPEEGRLSGLLRKRFEREAAVLRRLEHPGIVPLVKAGVSGEVPYLVTRWLAGGSLAERPPADPAQALDMAREVGSALAHAHAQGVLHRDLKPENLLFDEQGRIFLVDFGLAKDMSSDEALTDSRVLLGTPLYAAPEQLGAARRAGPQCDVYGLAAVLYFMLRGEPPFPVLSLHELHRAIERGPSSIAYTLTAPPELDALLCRALDPDLRIRHSLDEFRQDLERLRARLH